VAAANVTALESDKANYQNFNVGGGKGYTVLEFAKIVAEVCKVNWNLTPSGQYRVGDTRHSISAIEKLKKLGWTPTKTPKEAVAEYVEWLKTQDVDFSVLQQSEALMKKLGASYNYNVDAAEFFGSYSFWFTNGLILKLLCP